MSLIKRILPVGAFSCCTYLALSVPIVFPSASLAQDEAPAPAEGEEDYTKDEDYEIGSIFEKSTIAMEEENWEKAKFYLDRIIEEYGADADGFGPKFGVMHYRMGFCHSRLGNFEEALKEYAICMDKFANKPDTKEEMRNPLVANAVLESAAIKQREKKYDEAIEFYERFSTLKPEKGSYNEAFFYIEMGTSYVKSGQLDKGSEIIDNAFTRARAIKAQPKDLFRGFMSLVQGWVGMDGVEKEVEAKALAFMEKHGGALGISAYDKDRFGYNPQLLGYANTAAEKGMNALSFRLYGLVADASTVVEDLKARAAGYAEPPKLLVDETEKYTIKSKDGGSDDVKGLMGLAASYQRLGNFRVPFAIYSYLDRAYPDNPLRNHVVFGALQTASGFGDNEAAIKYGQILIDEFPNYEHRGKAISLMITKVFFSGDYEKALEMATALRAELAEGSIERDNADFVHAASQFYLGQYNEGMEGLAYHIETYPDSQFNENSRRIQSSGHIIKQDWVAGKKSSAQFLEDFPDSDFTDGVLLDLATCQYQFGDFDDALKTIQTMRTDHAASEMLDRALNMAGDVYYSRGAEVEGEEEIAAQYAKADETYSRALDTADRFQHQQIGAHSVSQLLAVAIAREDNEGGVKHYDKYWGSYAPGVYDATVAVGGLDALKVAGRLDEGMTKLEEVVVSLANSDDADGLERAISSYSDRFAEENGPEAAYSKLENFPLHGKPKTASLDAWLTMLRIDLLEDPANKKAFDRPEARLKVAYQELAEFDLGILPPYILLNVGNNLRKKENPHMATPFFEEVLKRETGDPEFNGIAQLRIAQIAAKSQDKAKQDEALAQFDKVLVDFEGTKYASEARVDKGMLLYRRNEWKGAGDALLAAYKDKKSGGNRAEIAFKTGRAYEQAGDTASALNAYTLFFAPPLQGAIEFSAEARVRAAQMQYDSGDKEKGYTLIRDTVFQMHKLEGNPLDKGKYITKAKQLYLQWKSELQKDEGDSEAELGIQF